MKRETKFLILAGVFFSIMVFISLISVKLINLFGVITTAGSIFYAITYLCTDVISECWGKRRAQKVIWIGFLVSALTMVFTMIVVALPPAEFWIENQEFFANLFALVPRIVIGGLIAYIISQNHDLWAFSFWRKKTSNKYLWLRNNASTAVSQLIDTLVFISIAFYGTMPGNILLATMFGHYIIKLIIAVIDTPFVYLLREWVGVSREILDKYEKELR